MEINGLNLHITVGDLEVYRAPHWWIESIRHYPLGRAGITLPDPARSLYKSVAIGDRVSIATGYRDQPMTAWNGTVSAIGPGATDDQLEIRAIDAAVPLTTTLVTQSWENETPEAIVAWAVRTAGLTPGRIDPTGVVIPRTVASGIPVWQLCNQLKETCRRAFGLNMERWSLWLGSVGVNWGDFDESAATVEIRTGANLISHNPTDWRSGMSRIETWLLPALSHSCRFQLRDERRGIDTEHRAIRVRHEGTPERIRTFIWYGVEHG